MNNGLAELAPDATRRDWAANRRLAGLRDGGVRRPLEVLRDLERHMGDRRLPHEATKPVRPPEAARRPRQCRVMHDDLLTGQHTSQLDESVDPHRRLTTGRRHVGYINDEPAVRLRVTSWSIDALGAGSHRTGIGPVVEQLAMTSIPPSTAGADVRRPANVKCGSKNSSTSTSPFNHAAVSAYNS